MKRLLFSVLLVAFLPFWAHSEENMSFHGTLVEPPCTIDNGQTIEVAFGNDLGVNKIDGVNYRRSVDYRIVCDTHYMPNELAIVVESSQPTAFDNSAIQTSQAGLGIRVYVDDQAAAFATRVKVRDPNSPPKVEVVPVQDPQATLEEGAFDATMTLRVDYM